MRTILTMMAAALVAGSALLHATQAQQPGIERTDVVRQDLDVTGREIIQLRVDLAPGTTAANHSHPGAEVAYVLQGTLEYQLEGKPPVTLKVGQALFIPSGTVHSAKNVGAGTASELATYVAEKGKPLIVPAQ